MSFPSASSSSSTKNKRCAMEFGAEWGQGKVFDWYRKNLTSKIINRLEIRITRGAVPHRFVVAYMKDGSTCRFDRRPQTPQGVFIPAGPQGPDEEPSCRAADEVSIVNKTELVEIELSTHWEIQLDLPTDTDVLLVISACFAIAQNKMACNYTLREYNCYFFSWTIVMLVTRHLFPFTVPLPANVESRFRSRLASSSAAITDAMAQAMLQGTLGVVATFDSEISKSLHQSLIKQELTVWGLPTQVILGLMRRFVKVHCWGIKKKLKQQVRFQLETRMVSMLRRILETPDRAAEVDQNGTQTIVHNGVADAIENRLWLDQLLADLPQLIHEAMFDVIWDAAVDAVVNSYSAIQADEIHQGFRRLSLVQRLKHRLLGEKVVQFIQIWSEALYALLPAAREATYGQYRAGKTFGDMFDLAFGAGAAPALRAVQDAVQRTGPELANPKRDEMWEVVWTIWEHAWEHARAATQAPTVALVEGALADLVGGVAEDVVKELGNNKEQKLQATIRLKRNRIRKQRLQGEGAELSLEVFQLNIAKFIRSVPGQTPEHYTNIAEAMSNAWNVSRKTYKPFANVDL